MPYTMWIKYLLALLIGFGLINSSYGKLSLSQYMSQARQCEKKNNFYIPLIRFETAIKRKFFYSIQPMKSDEMIFVIFPMKNKKFQRRWWKRRKTQ